MFSLATTTIMMPMATDRLPWQFLSTLGQQVLITFHYQQPVHKRLKRPRQTTLYCMPFSCRFSLRWLIDSPLRIGRCNPKGLFFQSLSSPLVVSDDVSNDLTSILVRRNVSVPSFASTMLRRSHSFAVGSTNFQSIFLITRPIFGLIRTHR